MAATGYCGDDMKYAAKKTLKESSGQIKNGTFNRAWEKVYGRTNYKPSWIHRLPEKKRPVPTITVDSDQTGEQIVIVPKGTSIIRDDALAREYQAKLVEGIPAIHRTKDALEPLKVSGKVVPNEKLLKKWHDVIKLDGRDSEGRPVYNKIVKDTNIPKWMDENEYGVTGGRIVVHKPDGDCSKLTDDRPITVGKHKVAHYDMVTRYENRVKRADLKVGNMALPDESTLNILGEKFDIPPDVGTRDYGSCVRTVDDQIESEGRKKFHAVIKQVNVSKFLDDNTFRPKPT